jgi:hypothetical protein
MTGRKELDRTNKGGEKQQDRNEGRELRMGRMKSFGYCF